MSFELTSMDRKVLQFVASNPSTGKTLSQIQVEFTQERQAARTSAARLVAARYVKRAAGTQSAHVLTDAGASALGKGR